MDWLCVVELHGVWRVGFGIDFWLSSVYLRKDSWGPIGRGTYLGQRLRWTAYQMGWIFRNGRLVLCTIEHITRWTVIKQWVGGIVIAEVSWRWTGFPTIVNIRILEWRVFLHTPFSEVSALWHVNCLRSWGSEFMWWVSWTGWGVSWELIRREDKIGLGSDSGVFRLYIRCEQALLEKAKLQHLQTKQSIR